MNTPSVGPKIIIPMIVPKPTDKGIWHMKVSKKTIRILSTSTSCLNLWNSIGKIRDTTMHNPSNAMVTLFTNMTIETPRAHIVFAIRYKTIPPSKEDVSNVKTISVAKFTIRPSNIQKGTCKR